MTLILLASFVYLNGLTVLCVPGGRPTVVWSTFQRSYKTAADILSGSAKF